MTTPWDSSAPATPDSLDEIIRTFDAGRQHLTDTVRKKDDDLTGTVLFPTAPKTIGDVPLHAFLWMTLSDQIHHRGQFSIYPRMADGKVPSIYGPTHDEPWF